jgi:hypothetical protein
MIDFISDYGSLFFRYDTHRSRLSSLVEKILLPSIHQGGAIMENVNLSFCLDCHHHDYSYFFHSFVCFIIHYSSFYALVLSRTANSRPRMHNPCAFWRAKSAASAVRMVTNPYPRIFPASSRTRDTSPTIPN